MQETVGAISEINRYPIKSFAGESLESCLIESYGVEGDRIGAFYDESKSEWWKYITARNIPNLMNYQARYVEGDITITAPDGRMLGWDSILLHEIQSQTTTAITMSHLKAPHPEPQHPQLLSVDGASILLLTDAGLAELESKWGKALDQRRFRGNFIVAVDDAAMREGHWIGRRLRIGSEVELQVDSYCKRCVMITMDPDDQKKDPQLLKKVVQDYDNCFGVYASVVKTGTIKLGDKVALGGD